MTECRPRCTSHRGVKGKERSDRFTRRRTAAVGDEAFTHSPVASRRNTGSPRYPSSTTVWPGFTVTPRARSLWKIWAEYAVVSGRNTLAR